MKCTGVSWSTSPHKKTGVVDRAKCKYCGKEYKMGWARDNHQKLCQEHKH